LVFNSAFIVPRSSFFFVLSVPAVARAFLLTHFTLAHLLSIQKPFSQVEL
jgi:hypothetical protein